MGIKIIFNHNRILERFDNDSEIITILLKDFRDTSGSLFDQVSNSLRARDKKASKDLIHGLKGIAANISADRLRYFCSDLEEKLDGLETVTTESVEEDLGKLKDEIELLVNETAQFIK